MAEILINKEQDETKDETFSIKKSLSTTNMTSNQSKVEELNLSQCPAYVPVPSPSTARGDEEVEDRKNGVYEIINPT